MTQLKSLFLELAIPYPIITIPKIIIIPKDTKIKIIYITYYITIINKIINTIAFTIINISYKIKITTYYLIKIIITNLKTFIKVTIYK